MRCTFRDADLEEAYRAEGYVVLSLLDATALDRIRSLAAPLVRTRPGQFAATLYDDDVAHRTEVDRVLRPAFAAALAPHLEGQRAFVANLLAKPPGAGTELGVHQDWTFVDEPAWTSATAWCPLVDVDERNGALAVFAGSHLLGPTWRGSPRLPSPFDGWEGPIHDHRGTTITCPAGSAVVYDHRLVHWSGANQGPEARVAVGVGLAPAEATLVHLHADAAGVVTRYEVDDGFLDDLAFGRPPATGRPAGTVEVPDVRFTAAELGLPPAPAGQEPSPPASTPGTRPPEPEPDPEVAPARRRRWWRAS